MNIFNFCSGTLYLIDISDAPWCWYLLQENLQHWLTDAKARDQFVIRAGSDTEVLWNDARHLKPDPVYKRAVSGRFISVSCTI